MCSLQINEQCPWRRCTVWVFWTYAYRVSVLQCFYVYFYIISHVQSHWVWGSCRSNRGLCLLQPPPAPPPRPRPPVTWRAAATDRGTTASTAGSASPWRSCRAPPSFFAGMKNTDFDSMNMLKNTVTVINDIHDMRGDANMTSLIVGVWLMSRDQGSCDCLSSDTTIINQTVQTSVVRIISWSRH